MRKKQDYYSYWVDKGHRRELVQDREKISIKLLSTIIKEGDFFLDLGSGHGRFMNLVSKKFRNVRAKGIDLSKKEVDLAKKLHRDVILGDFENEGIKLKPESVDIIFAGEVIEHVYDPDFFLSEANKALKKGGYLMMTTPNLCAWFNRILMIFGIQPLFLEPSTKSKLIGAGILKKFKKESQPVGHVRIFTLEALKDLLKENGYQLLTVKGYIYDTGFPRQIQSLDKLFRPFPTLSAGFVLLAKKIRSVNSQ